MSQKRRAVTRRILILLIPLAAAAAAVLLARLLPSLRLPACPSYEIGHFYCPGCGATRSVIALGSGDLLLALRQNAAIVTMAVIAVMYWVELVLWAFGKNFKFPFLHSFAFLYIMLGLLAVYAVLRNLVPALAPIIIR